MWVTCSSIELVDYRAGLRGYVQFNKHTHTHTFFLQQALSFRTRHHLCRQGVALASTRQPHSQGPASVQAHRTGGVTGSEGQKGANGVGCGIGVGGGNGDGNGDVNGHGDGDGAERERGWK